MIVAVRKSSILSIWNMLFMISVAKIYEIIAEKYVIHSRWKENKKRGKIPTAEMPREVIPMNAVFLVISMSSLLLITSLEKPLFLIAPKLTSEFDHQFLSRSMKRRFGGRVHFLQTDRGLEFKVEFKNTVHSYCNHYRISRYYRKN